MPGSSGSDIFIQGVTGFFNLPVAELAVGAPFPFCVCVHTCPCWEVAEAGVSDKPGLGAPSPLLEEVSSIPAERPPPGQLTARAR